MRSFSLRHRTNSLLVFQEVRLEPARTGEFDAARQLPARVDGRVGLLRAPAADRIEVLRRSRADPPGGQVAQAGVLRCSSIRLSVRAIEVLFFDFNMSAPGGGGGGGWPNNCSSTHSPRFVGEVRGRIRGDGQDARLGQQSAPFRSGKLTRAEIPARSRPPAMP